MSIDLNSYINFIIFEAISKDSKGSKTPLERFASVVLADSGAYAIFFF